MCSQAFVINRDQAADLVGAKADGRRIANAVQDRDIEKLADDAFDAHPLHRVAAPGIDHHQPAARLGAARAQRLVERQALEGAVLARLRDADDGMGAYESEASRITG